MISLMKQKQFGVSYYEFQKHLWGRKDTCKIETESGFELICTPDHKVHTNDGWVKAEDLDPLRHRV